MVSFADRLDRARAAYARGLAGHPIQRPTPDDASESLGLRDRARSRPTRPTTHESSSERHMYRARGTARRPDAP